jgi:hypothetical protein
MPAFIGNMEITRFQGKLVSERSFGLSVARTDIPEGNFGYVAPYWCSSCNGPCDEPVYHMTHRQTLEQPEEGEETCPSCGSEECGEHTDPAGMKILGRRRVKL